jgi:hypothetical protein
LDAIESQKLGMAQLLYGSLERIRDDLLHTMSKRSKKFEDGGVEAAKMIVGFFGCVRLKARCIPVSAAHFMTLSKR